jgi:hypothetical protein
MADETRKVNVFISYSRDDLAFADQLHAALPAFGYGVTIDRESIPGGDAWKKRLGVLIRDADSVVFVLSPSSSRARNRSFCPLSRRSLGRIESPSAR